MFSPGFFWTYSRLYNWQSFRQTEFLIIITSNNKEIFLIEFFTPAGSNINVKERRGHLEGTYATERTYAVAQHNSHMPARIEEKCRKTSTRIEETGAES